MGGSVEVYSKTTGKKHIVPEHWLDHPVLGKNFARTPSSVATKTAAPEGDPSEAWTRAQLDQHADGLGLDTTALPNKGEVVAAIEARAQAMTTTAGSDPAYVEPVVGDNATQNPDGTEPPAQTPAAGENQE